jgi:hypothetical protein
MRHIKTSVHMTMSHLAPLIIIIGEYTNVAIKHYLFAKTFFKQAKSRESREDKKSCCCYYEILILSPNDSILFKEA